MASSSSEDEADTWPERPTRIQPYQSEDQDSERVPPPPPPLPLHEDLVNTDKTSIVSAAELAGLAIRTGK